MASSSTASILRSLFRLPKNNALELDLNLDKVKVWATSLRAGFKIMGSFVGKVSYSKVLNAFRISNGFLIFIVLLKIIGMQSNIRTKGV